MSYLAHSARPKKGISTHEYGVHIRASRAFALQYAEECGRYSELFGATLMKSATLAGEFHDLGKLDDQNQQVLAGNGSKKLPVPHVDAGPAYLLKNGGADQASMYAALVCYAHHRGLPSIPKERNRSEHWMRESSSESRAHTDEHLGEYLKRHRECIDEIEMPNPDKLGTNSTQLLLRLALSCQADADHGDTARHYGDEPLVAPPVLRAEARLAALDDYVQQLHDRDPHSSHTILRDDIFRSCRKASTRQALYACDAPVGSGKTTAVMAHLLKAAHDKRLRRIFVVLPYTNIISQAVDVYRKALVLESEIPAEIVAEHHHKADYATPDSRKFTMLWQSPIVVTTAVQFFETLASNMPAELRKLHRLPGSAVFFDEVHAALPAHLWPQAWLWLNDLSKHWGCHFVFASGSLTRFWELPDFHPQTNLQKSSTSILPKLVTRASQTCAFEQEQKRVSYRTNPKPVDLTGLIEWVGQYEGPRLLVMNTVQSAAAVAREIANRDGCEKVEHLSTALTSSDRETTLNRIQQRLSNSSDSDWVLVATSCMEAGVDLSFRVGFRERASLMSLVQLGGRVNRQFKETDAEVWDFQIIPDELLRLHPKLRTSACILGKLFNENKVTPEFCKEAFKREIRWDKTLNDEILRNESAGDARNTDFPKVAELFKVIDSNTVTVVIDNSLQERLRKGISCGRDELQKHCVQIWGWRVSDLHLEEFNRFPGVYGWCLQYDNFLGYMAGLLPHIEFVSGKPTVI